MSHTPTHTPTPWKYREGWECYQLCAANGMPIGLTDYPSDGRNIFREEAEANASHIIHCVNTYDQLVEALHALRNEVTGLLGLAETDLRTIVGPTNLTVLQRKLADSDSALAAVEKGA